MDIRRAHTSEHIFMRALTTIREDVVVRKVEHGLNINEIYVEAVDLTWDDVIKASLITNMVILDNRPVYIEMFDSMDDALRKYPSLRAYEERIKPPIRVIVIEGYDYAACMMPHVERTGEAYIFIPIALNKAKRNRYIIKYLVGESAIGYALRVSRLVDEFSERLSSDVDRVLNALDNLIERNLGVSRRVRLLTRHVFENSPEYALNGICVKYVVAPSIDIDEVGRLADAWIKNNYGIVVAVSVMEGGNRLLLAANDLVDIDLRVLANRLFSVLGGRGGGRPNWVMGRIDTLDNLLSVLYDAIADLI